MCKGLFCTHTPLLNKAPLEEAAGLHRVDARGCASLGGMIPGRSCPLRGGEDGIVRGALGPRCLCLNPGFTTY